MLGVPHWYQLWALPAFELADAAPASPELDLTEVFQTGASAPQPSDDDSDHHQDDLERQHARVMTGRVVRDRGCKQMMHSAQSARLWVL